MAALENKIDFAIAFAVNNANPNGDPLNGNRPRTTSEGLGEVSDVALKRKIRNRLQDAGESVFVQSDDRSDDGAKSLSDRFNTYLKTLPKDEQKQKNVMTEDAYLALENDNVVIYQNDKTLAKVPLRSIEGIMCFSYKGASPALMGRCGKLGISMAFYSPRGHYYCSVLGEENRNVLLRREQFRVADDEQKSLRYAKSFIVGKLYNAKWVLERTKRDHALRVNIDRLAEQSGKLSAALLKARKSLTVDELRGVEGLAAKDYFYAFDDLVLKNKDDFFFTSRSRRPPLDRLNALLSFCYSILTNDCIAALQGVGLDPYVGFMHTDRPGRASLALDLVEEFRPVLADRFVLTLVNTGAVKPGDFEIRENGGVLLSDFGRKKVLTAWQKKKSDQILHPFLQEKISWGLVPYVQALLLARSLRGDLDDYPPFMWK